MANGFKTGGRKPGSTNRVGRANREILQAIFEKQVDSGKIEEELNKLSGKEYLDMIVKLCGFLIPKKQTEEEEPPGKTDYYIMPVGTMEEVKQARLNDLDEETHSKLLYYSSKQTGHKVNDPPPT